MFNIGGVLVDENICGGVAEAFILFTSFPRISDNNELRLVFRKALGRLTILDRGIRPKNKTITRYGSIFNMD
jgi:hypothetical protein